MGHFRFDLNHRLDRPGGNNPLLPRASRPVRHMHIHGILAAERARHSVAVLGGLRTPDRTQPGAGTAQQPARADSRGASDEAAAKAFAAENARAVAAPVWPAPRSPPMAGRGCCRLGYSGEGRGAALVLDLRRRGAGGE